MVTIKGIRVKLVNYESCSDSFRSILVCYNFRGSSSFLIEDQERSSHYLPAPYLI